MNLILRSFMTAVLISTAGLSDQENEFTDESTYAYEVAVSDNKIVPLVCIPDSECEDPYYCLNKRSYSDELSVSDDSLYNSSMAPSSIYERFSFNDIYLICRMVESETHSCDFYSKVHVAEVVFARVDSPRFSNEVSKIIVPGQFVYNRTNISFDTMLAVEYAYSYESRAEGALFFQKAERSKWNGCEYLFKDNCGHCFYR